MYKITIFLTLTWCALSPYSVQAGLFGEHKEISDSAFVKFQKRLFGLLESSVKKDTSKIIVSAKSTEKDTSKIIARTFLESYHQAIRNVSSVDTLSYGDISALSLDYVPTPIQLREELQSGTRLIGILNAHRKALANNLLEAPREQLGLFDPLYQSQGTVDFIYHSTHSHFYEYNETFERHIEKLNAQKFSTIVNILKEDSVTARDNLLAHFAYLENESNIASYIAYHAIALHFAKIAGNKKVNLDGTPQANRIASEYFSNAIIFNAFADHFIQECFSAKHFFFQDEPISLKKIGRNISTTLKMYDLFGQQGVRVENLEDPKSSWLAFGDGYLKQGPLENFAKQPASKGFELSIQATRVSLDELYEEFSKGYKTKDAQYTVLDSIDSFLADRSVTFKRWDIKWSRFLNKLQRDTTKASKHILKLIQKEITPSSENRPDFQKIERDTIQQNTIITIINKRVLGHPYFYALCERIPNLDSNMPDEAKRLLGNPRSRSYKNTQQLNRLLLETIYPEEIRKRPSLVNQSAELFKALKLIPKPFIKEPSGSKYENSNKPEDIDFIRTNTGEKFSIILGGQIGSMTEKPSFALRDSMAYRFGIAYNFKGRRFFDNYNRDRFWYDVSLSYEFIQQNLEDHSDFKVYGLPKISFTLRNLVRRRYEESSWGALLKTIDNLDLSIGILLDSGNRVADLVIGVGFVGKRFKLSTEFRNTREIIKPRIILTSHWNLLK